jgi:hypothetical protein
LWVSKDTTMRDRTIAISRPPGSRRPGVHSSACESAAEEVARQFTPEQIDLDDLAQAVRALLGEGNTPHTDLLLSGHRGSHVVGANDTP